MKKLIFTLCIFSLIMFITTSLSAQSSSGSNESPYQTAIGLRAAWGVAGSLKHFISENDALEATVNFRNYGYLGFSYNSIRISGYYQRHNYIPDLEIKNLRWYYGAGAYIGFYGGKWSNVYNTGNNFFLGISGVLGLDYKFEELPINISLDWIPSLNIIGSGDNFSAQGGGIAVRYTF